MGAIAYTVCARCHNGFAYAETIGKPSPEECQVCVKLGDRSLVWFMRAMKEAVSPEARESVKARFTAAKGRSTPYAKEGR